MPIEIGQERDPLERNMPGLGLGRDGARTPMQWAPEAYGAFSRREPWLPLAPDFRAENVLNQSRDQDSIFNLHRRLIALRRTMPALSVGTYHPIVTEGELLLFVRQRARERVLVALNFGADAAVVDFGSEQCRGRVLLSALGDREGEPVADRIELGGNEGLLIAVESSGRRCRRTSYSLAVENTAWISRCSAENIIAYEDQLFRGKPARCNDVHTRRGRLHRAGGVRGPNFKEIDGGESRPRPCPWGRKQKPRPRRNAVSSLIPSLAAGGAHRTPPMTRRELLEDGDVVPRPRACHRTGICEPKRLACSRPTDRSRGQGKHSQDCRGIRSASKASAHSAARGKRAEVGHSEPARILPRWFVPLGVTLQRHDGPGQSSSVAPGPSPVR